MVVVSIHNKVNRGMCSDENVRLPSDLFVESMDDHFFSMYACNSKAREDMGV